MAKRQSISARAKKAENRVVRYLFGADKFRDWKDERDIHGDVYAGDDADGQEWVGECKNYAWPAGPKRMWSILFAALEQCEGYSTRAFAVFIPVHCEVADALVMWRHSGIPIVTTAESFRDRLCKAPPVG